MAAPSRNDPYQAFKFLVEIDGIQSAGFTECTGLSTETDVIEYREGNERGGVRKIPGLAKFANITLKRGLTRSRDLWNWRKVIIDGGIDRRSGVIVVLGDNHPRLHGFNFARAGRRNGKDPSSMPGPVKSLSKRWRLRTEAWRWSSSRRSRLNGPRPASIDLSCFGQITLPPPASS